MKARRDLIKACGLAVLVGAMPAFVRAQAKARRIGFLYFGSRQSALRTGRYKAFLDGMGALKYAAGKDFVVEERFAEGKIDAVQRFAAELVHAKVDIIIASGTPAIHAARRATTTIPIVVAVMGGDPVASGLAKSLARPGGNVTGLYISNSELLAKQVELLALVAPKLSRLGVLANPTNVAHPGLLKTMQGIAQTARLEIVAAEARTADEIERGFAAVAQQRVDALIVLGDTYFVQQAPQLANLAAKHRIPLISTTREYVDAGGLMSYGENATDNFRLAADYVDKIFNGAKPGDLPFGRSQRPHLVINRSTFRTLGLAIPQDFILRADAVVE